MAKLLKLRGGTTTQHGSFTGADREVTVDTDKETLVVHDGSTAGGFSMMRSDIMQENLDVNGNSIVSSSNGNISITPNGTGKVILDGLSHPTSDGTSGQFMTTDGSGNLSFATVVGTTINNNADNRIITGSGTANTLEGEANLTFDGTNLDMGDSKKIRLGASQDLEIYHDSNHSYVEDTGTGELRLKTNGSAIRFQHGDETLSLYTEDGSVELFHDDSKKFETTSGGVAVTGDVYASGNIGLDSTDFISFTGNTRMDITVNGSNEFRFESDGDFHADGDVIAFSTTVSDERLKTDIEKIENATDKVSQLNGYTFTYKDDGKKSAGVIAQEVEKVLPSAVSEKELPLKTDDGVAYKTVQYDQIIGLLIESIKELKQEINQLKGA